MNWVPTKLGAERKKIAILAGLLLVAGYFYFSNSDSPGDARVTVRTAAAPEPLRTVARPNSRSASRNLMRSAGNGPKEWQPRFPGNKDIDPSKVDPTLHLSALARLAKVEADAGTRSLFDIAPEAPAKLDVKEPAKIAVSKIVGPMPQAKAAEPEKPAEPKAPPIPLKFYGFVNPPKAGIKRAFFLDGDDIVIAAEGDMIKKRYKIVRIGVNSAVIEDTQFKSNNQQTLPLEAEMAG